MIFPHALQPVVASLEPVVARWPDSVSMAEVARWLLQFEPEDYDLGARVVRNLNILSLDDIRQGLRAAYARLQRKAVERKSPIEMSNTMFLAIGDTGKSGAAIAYDFRIANELPESNFDSDAVQNYLSQGLVKNIVLIDDVVSTGDTASAAAREIKEEAVPLGVQNVFVLAVCGYADGLRKVEEETGAHAFAAYSYASIDTVKSLDSRFYDSLQHAERVQCQERIKYYDRVCSRSDFGYGNVGGLLVLSHNTPNTTIPIVWSTGNGWRPLFPRVGRIQGIETFAKQALAAQQRLAAKQQVERKADPVADHRRSLELTLLVEGATDEAVLDFIVEHWKLAELVGVGSLSVVPVGSVFRAGRLLDLLESTERDFLLVLETNETTRSWIESLSEPERPPIVCLQPNTAEFLNLDKLGAAHAKQIQIDAQVNILEDRSEKAYFAAERYLKRLGLGRHPARTKKLLETYVSEDRVLSFAERLTATIPAVEAKRLRKQGG